MRLDVGQQFLIADEFVFPVTVATRQIAGWATAADVQPANIFRTSVKSDTQSDLEDVSATSAFGNVDFGLIEDVIGVGHAEFTAAGLAESNSNTDVFVEAKLKRGCAAIATGISEVLRNVPIQFTITDEFRADVSLRISERLIVFASNRHIARGVQRKVFTTPP